MKARWGGTCPKCETVWQPGDEIKPWFRRVGFNQEGKPIYERVPKQWVHAPKCPKVTPRRVPRGVDPATGEVVMGDWDAPPPYTQEEIW